MLFGRLVRCRHLHQLPQQRLGLQHFPGGLLTQQLHQLGTGGIGKMGGFA